MQFNCLNRVVKVTSHSKLINFYFRLQDKDNKRVIELVFVVKLYFRKPFTSLVRKLASFVTNICGYTEAILTCLSNI